VPSREQDEAFFEAGVRELNEYLLSDELFWPLAGNVALPRLTIGGLLLARARLLGWVAGQDEAVRLRRQEIELEATRTRWRSAWERKAAREVRARFELWRNYLQEYRASPAEHADAYPLQVRWRAMLQLLLAELSEMPPQAQALTDLDRFLRSRFLPGTFVWEAKLANVFPAGNYWYLYGGLKP
jgi:hypothetical protein